MAEESRVQIPIPTVKLMGDAGPVTCQITYFTWLLRMKQRKGDEEIRNLVLHP